MKKGNIVNWNTAVFETRNMTEYLVNEEEICTPVRPGHIVMPMRRTFAEHLSICRQFHGLPLVVSDWDTQVEVVEVAQNTSACLGNAHHCKCST